MEFFTNYYNVQIDLKKLKLYQYVLESDVPADSTEILYKMIRSISGQLKDRIGFVSFRGNMLWGNKSSNIPVNLVCKYTVGENGDRQEVSQEVMIKQTK